MSNKVNGKEKLVRDILRMLEVGSSNDVKVVLEDGEILANKDILSARCDYFATCFSNKETKFIEGETNSVDMSHCSKAVMDKIITFLFIGDVELHDLSVVELHQILEGTLESRPREVTHVAESLD